MSPSTASAWNRPGWRLAKRLGLQVVIESTKGGTTVYHDDGLDITNPVIEEFNRDYP